MCGLRFKTKEEARKLGKRERREEGCKGGERRRGGKEHRAHTYERGHTLVVY